MTEILRFSKKAEFEPLLLNFIVKVLEPAVKPVITTADDTANCALVAAP